MGMAGDGARWGWGRAGWGLWSMRTCLAGRRLPICLRTRGPLNWRRGPIRPTVAAGYPASTAAWAALAERALDQDDWVAGYAFARTGYHRGLDQLRRAGWKGHGPVPWEHEPNQGFLRALHALGRAAAAIGEQDEAERCQAFLADSSATAAAALSSQ